VWTIGFAAKKWRLVYRVKQMLQVVAVVLCRSFLVDFRHIFVNFFEFIQRS